MELKEIERVYQAFRDFHDFLVPAFRRNTWHEHRRPGCGTKGVRQVLAGFRPGNSWDLQPKKMQIPKCPGVSIGKDQPCNFLASYS